MSQSLLGDVGGVLAGEVEQPSRLKDVMKGAIRSMGEAAGREIAEDAITSLTSIYLSTENLTVARQCRLTIKALLSEYGPEKGKETSEAES